MQLAGKKIFPSLVIKDSKIASIKLPCSNCHNQLICCLVMWVFTNNNKLTNKQFNNWLCYLESKGGRRTVDGFERQISGSSQEEETACACMIVLCV